MSSVGEAFIQGIGRPNPIEPTTLRFSKSLAQRIWEQLQEEIGSGWYMNKFLYLFGDELNSLSPCLEAWDFLFESQIDRKIIGKNAYGFLLVIEALDTQGINAPVGLIDPWNVRYWNHDGLGFINLIGNWLPEGRIPGFLQNILYESWQGQTQNYLDFSEMIAIKQPLSLGGEIEADNFQVKNLVEYYQTTAPIYRKL
jgi:hypothetical protein